MVSSTNLTLAGIALVVGFFVLRGSSPTTAPAVSVADIQKENPQIQILKDAIAGVQNFISTTFKAPIIPKGLGGGPCRGPNCLGSFQSRGLRTSFDPFTGQRVLVGFSDRASTFLKKINPQVPFNVAKITAGGDLLKQAQGIVKDLQGQLNILQTKSV